VPSTPITRLADLVLADEDLDPLGPVAQVEEDDLALPALERDPPGDAHSRAWLRFAAGRRRENADVRDRMMTIEPLSPRVVPERGDPAHLLQADGFQVLTFRFGHPRAFGPKGLEWVGLGQILGISEVWSMSRHEPFPRFSPELSMPRTLIS
jgi:hypothetical protein